MKRFCILLAVVFVCAGIALAEESILIDFAKLTADQPADKPAQNKATMVDFSNVAGSSFNAEEKNAMKTSLAINNWEVVLASSSRSVFNQTYSMAKPAKVKDSAKSHAGANVLGVRIHFPEEPFNSWAIVQPPFDIPAYMDKADVKDDGSLSTPQAEVGKGSKFDSFGVVKNVGVLKSLSMNVHGLNFPQAVSVVLRDENSEEQEIVLGNLQFDGWRTMTWQNPNYVTEVRNRDLRVFPLYPKSAPMRKLVGVRFYRDAAQDGGDFVAYLKDISIVYDKAVLSLERDIDDEATWGILQKREEARRNAELKRLGNIQVLRYLEQKKMHAEKPQTAPAPK
jgi:hypothetical protein